MKTFLPSSRKTDPAGFAALPLALAFVLGLLRLLPASPAPAPEDGAAGLGGGHLAGFLGLGTGRAIPLWPERKDRYHSALPPQAPARGASFEVSVVSIALAAFASPAQLAWRAERGDARRG